MNNHRLLILHPSGRTEVTFDQQLTIGRDVYNSLCLHDPEISRSHAIIFEHNGDVIIKDLRSRNGIYVNGLKVADQALVPGDELILGSTVLFYEPSEGFDPEAVMSERARAVLERAAKEAPPPPPPHTVTDFSHAELDQAIAKLLSDGEKTTYVSLPNMVMLLQAFKALDDTTDARGLFNQTLDHAMRIVGGHRGILMEVDEMREQLTVRALRARGERSAVRIAEPILRILLEDERCLYCRNVAGDPRFASLAGDERRPIHSFVASTIRSDQDMIGFIYLESTSDAYVFDFTSLRSLYLLASHAGALLRRRPLAPAGRDEDPFNAAMR